MAEALRLSVVFLVPISGSEAVFLDLLGGILCGSKGGFQTITGGCLIENPCRDSSRIVSLVIYVTARR